MQLKNVICLVTGGASGLGAATVRRLIKNGAKVAVVDIQEDKGEQMAEELGKDCTFVLADISSKNDVSYAVTKTLEKYGSLNALVNCAAFAPLARCISDDGECHSLEVFEKTVKTNVTGMFDLTRLVAKAMTNNQPNEEGERGVIINVSSTHAFEGVPLRLAYATTKGAINSMTLPLARDLARYGIRVMAIAPGLFETPMFLKARSDPVERAELFKSVPFPSRAGKPDEFAHLAQAIIENPMLNGAILRIDGAFRLTK